MKPRIFTVSNGVKVPVKLCKAGEVDFRCPNCGRHIHRVLWEHIIDEFGFNPVIAYAKCRCGVSLMVADDGKGKLAVYRLKPSRVERDGKEALKKWLR